MLSGLADLASRAQPGLQSTLCITTPPTPLWGKAMLSAADVLPYWTIANRHQRAAALPEQTPPPGLARAARMTCNMEHMLAKNRADNVYISLTVAAIA